MRYFARLWIIIATLAVVGGFNSKVAKAVEEKGWLEAYRLDCGNDGTFEDVYPVHCSEEGEIVYLRNRCPGGVFDAIYTCGPNPVAKPEPEPEPKTDDWYVGVAPSIYTTRSFWALGGGIEVTRAFDNIEVRGYIGAATTEGGTFVGEGEVDITGFWANGLGLGGVITFLGANDDLQTPGLSAWAWGGGATFKYKFGESWVLAVKAEVADDYIAPSTHRVGWVGGLTLTFRQ